jgi:hypothetical protein
MDAMKKAELLEALKNDFDDYIDYYDLMECLPDILEEKIDSLRRCRSRNGLDKISYYTHRDMGVLMVSASGFRRWVENDFRKEKEKGA